jgi:hypothetical protein
LHNESKNCLNIATCLHANHFFTQVGHYAAQLQGLGVKLPNGVSALRDTPKNTKTGEYTWDTVSFGEARWR